MIIGVVCFVLWGHNGTCPAWWSMLNRSHCFRRWELVQKPRRCSAESKLKICKACWWGPCWCELWALWALWATVSHWKDCEVKAFRFDDSWVWARFAHTTDGSFVAGHAGHVFEADGSPLGIHGDPVTSSPKVSQCESPCDLLPGFVPFAGLGLPEGLCKMAQHLKPWKPPNLVSF